MVDFLSIFTNDITWIIIWIVLFVVALVVELSTEQLVSIWFCGSSIICLILAICSVNWIIQLVCFVVVSSILLIVSRFLIKKDQQKSIPTNVDSLIGQEIKIIKKASPTSFGEGKVRDVIWSIKTSSGEIEENEVGIIKEIEGNHLIIERKEN